MASILSRVPRVWLVAGGGWTGRIVQVVGQLIAVRVMTDSLGSTGYSVFAVLASLVGWIALTDFSVAISLQNYISERRVADEETDDLILTASLLALGATLIASLMVIVLGPWAARLLLGAFSGINEHLKLLAFWAIAFPSIGTALGGVAYKVWFAEHRGYLSNLMPALGTTLGVLSVWIVARVHAEPVLPLTILVYYAPLAILPLAALAAIVARLRRQHRPSWDLARALLHRAGRFWLFGLLAAAVLQVDFIILAQVLPPEDIVIYSIASRIFGLVFFVYNALLLALWPVCSEAIAAGRWDAVFGLVRRYLGLGAGMVVIAGLGFALTRDLAVHLLAPTIRATIPIPVIALLTGYIIVRIWADTFAMVLQSMNDLTIFWLVVPFQSLFSVVLQWLGARYFGLPGMIIGLIACFLLTVSWVFPLRCRRHARRSCAAQG